MGLMVVAEVYERTGTSDGLQSAPVDSSYWSSSFYLVSVMDYVCFCVPLRMPTV